MFFSCCYIYFRAKVFYLYFLSKQGIMLDHFFLINLPYGIRRDADGQWMAFNREYLPLGFASEDFSQSMGGLPSAWTPYSDYPVYSKYKNLSKKILMQIALNEDKVNRDENGEIYEVFFYDTASNPINQQTKANQIRAFTEYFERITPLLRLKILTD
jgi:hypothetical protein